MIEALSSNYRVLLALLALLAFGCGDSTSSGEQAGPNNGNGVVGDEPVGGSGPTATPTVAYLDIHALDIWARPLSAETSEMTLSLNGAPMALSDFPKARVPMTAAGSYQLILNSEHHDSTQLSVDFDGGLAPAGVIATLANPGSGVGVTVTHHHAEDGLPVHSVYIGLRHQWFSAQASPPTNGNQLELLFDGEAGWGALHEDLEEASSSVLLSSWWWESDFELVRSFTGHHNLSSEQRWANTIMGTLEASPASKRVLVGQFWSQDGIFSGISVDSELHAYAQVPGDAFEFMGQANETSGVFWFEAAGFFFGDRVRAQQVLTTDTSFDAEDPIASNVPTKEVDLTEYPTGIEMPIASYHQKFAVIDEQVAYVGGMNIKDDDWDTSDHRVFDHRRMEYGASKQDRVDVLNKDSLPDIVSRKDYVLRIEGPAVHDVADVFSQRWEHLREEGVEYAENSTTYVPAAASPELSSGMQVQITTTLPEPFWEHSIAETWVNAIDHAQDFILIEDQYFRMELLNQRILQRMQEVPDLRLIVLTNRVGEWFDAACAATYLTNQLFQAAVPDRYLLLQIRAFDHVVTWGIDETESRFEDINIHSKLIIVDDLFLSVGSANKNNRSLIYDGEMNAAVVDADWVSEQRRRVLRAILPSTVEVADDSAQWWEQLQTAAAYNDAVYQAWDDEGHDINLNGAALPSTYQPQGFVYSLEFGPLSECLFESVGPDVVGAPNGGAPPPAP